MIKQTPIAALSGIVGSQNVRAPGPDATVDGMTPEAMVRPADYEQVAAVLRYAHDNSLAIIPWGGGQHMHTGNIPARYTLALDMTLLNRIIEHEPADLTITCQAGITLRALREHMAASGQSTQLDPTLPPGATVGGVLATAAYGPARLAYGAPRDFTIGLRVATPDGRITRAGGKVVKNVAGYDLCKLYTGSFGTLGVILEATFKAIPLPLTTGEFAAAFPAPRDACTIASEAHRRSLSLRSATITNRAQTGDDPAVLLSIGLAGSPAGVERSLSELAEMVPAYGGSRAGSGASSPETLPLTVRISVLPAALPGLFQHLDEMDARPRLTALPTIGTLWASWPDGADLTAVLGDLQQTTLSVGGTLIVERSPLDIKREIDVFGEQPPSFPLMRRIKQQFDPNAVLNPGRFLGGL